MTTPKPPLLAWLRKQGGACFMDYIYAQLVVIYPGKWDTFFRTQQEVQVWREAWAHGLDRRQITREQVRSALDRLPELYADRPPTFGQFIAVCRATRPEGGDTRKIAPIKTKEQIEHGRKRARELSEMLASKKRMDR